MCITMYFFIASFYFYSLFALCRLVQSTGFSVCCPLKSVISVLFLGWCKVKYFCIKDIVLFLCFLLKRFHVPHLQVNNFSCFTWGDSDSSATSFSGRFASLQSVCVSKACHLNYKSFDNCNSLCLALCHDTFQ